jgi:RNA polymerase sigma-70 factor, ECF subfamily
MGVVTQESLDAWLEPYHQSPTHNLGCNGAMSATSKVKARGTLERTDPGTWDERTLLEAARQGRREAMEGLVRLHQDRVFSVLRRCVPPDEVEDLAQEAFLRAFSQISRFRGDSRFGTWLFRIVRNLMIDRQRRRARAPERIGLLEETGVPDDAQVPDPSPSPEQALEARRLQARLDRALSQLGETDRLALLLHDQEGLSAGEVARAVGGTAGAIRIRLFRARRKVRTMMEEDER